MNVFNFARSMRHDNMPTILSLPLVLGLIFVSGYSTWLFYRKHRYAAGSAYVLATAIFSAVLLVMMSPYILFWLPNSIVRGILELLREKLINHAEIVSLVAGGLLVVELVLAEWVCRKMAPPPKHNREPEVIERDVHTRRRPYE